MRAGRCGFLLLIGAIVRVTIPTGPTAALQPGDVLDQHNWQEAEGLLPPEVLGHYRKGEYANRIAEWPEGAMRWDEDFAEALRTNAARYAVSEAGTLIEKGTGRQPPFVTGLPFPVIDPQDSAAAVKIVWNHLYGFWSQGNNHTVTMLNLIGRSSLDRAISQDVYFLYYDGQPSWRRPASNPNNLMIQNLATAMSPADLQGTAALTWRYRDPHKRDAVWAFVPALRRVRQVSPSNRSDGFLGSDLSQDDGPFFDGKPEDFTWRLAGETEVYRYCDPYSLKGETQLRPLDSGGWRIILKDQPMVGYQDRNWRGLAWAPVSMVLARRKCWVVEAVPKDQYYLYGKIQLYIDKETYQGAFSRKFDWRGELVMVYGVVGLLNVSPDGKNYFRGFSTTWQGAENIKLGRATVAGPPPADIKDAATDYDLPLEPRLFDHQMLLRSGK